MNEQPTSKYRQWGKKLFSTGFAHVFLGNSFCKILSFASGLILVRLLSKEEYGIYAYAYNIFSFFLLASGFGLNSGTLQLCSELDGMQGEEKLYQYSVNHGLVINVVLAMITILVSWFVPLPIAGANKLLAMFAFMIVPILMTDLQITRLRTRLMTQQYAYANVLSTVLILVGSVIGALLGYSEGLIAGRYLAYIALSIALALRMKSGLLVTREKPQRQHTRSLWKISFISMFNNGLSALLNLLEIIFLGMFIKNEAVVASYKVATTIPFALDFIPNAFVIYIYPYFAKRREDKTWVRKKYSLALTAVGVITGSIAAVMTVLAPFVIRMCFGEQYLDSLGSFRILMIAFAVGGTFRVISGNVLVMLRRLKFNFVVAIIGTIVNVVANWILIPRIGAQGAAVAHLIIVTVTGFINTAGVIWFTRRDAKPVDI